MALLIVESPTKARTLSRFLGSQYQTESTMGHVRDLPKSKLGVDIEKDFTPEYVPVKGKRDAMKTITQQAKKAKQIYLATDPDREGEAIAWHVYQSFKNDSKFPFKSKTIGRIVFHEITQSAVEEALKHVTKINLPLVDAQQARRVLDRLVGYKLSPLLWKKVRRGLSAGRVQSVAVRLIVDREKQRQAFKPEEFWIIGADLKIPKSDSFWAELKEKNHKKFQAKSQKQADPVVKDLNAASYSVSDVKKRQVTKSAPPPFTTSILQQRAASKFGWSAKRTMRAAQRLYEQGLITYHRTDSYNLAPKAISAVRDFIKSQYGDQYLPDKPNFFKKKSKLAQEAHEAIRPTKVNQLSVKSPSLKTKSRKQPKAFDNHSDQTKLYHLIHQRFVACQMTPAVWDETRVSISAVKDSTTYTLTATGRIEKFLGWRAVYKSDTKGKKSEVKNQNPSNIKSDKDAILPPLVVDQLLDLVKVTSEQKFTQPPPRYGVASLIKELEKLGIGRPSTYAPIISTIQDRQYVELQDKSFVPTPVGFAVTEFLLTNFPQVMDYQFTAGMEENLDKIAQGDKQWVPVIRDFYTPFSDKLDHVESNSQRVKIATEKTGDQCPQCQKGDVVIRVGRFGKFLSCSRFPECKYTANFVDKIDIKCPECSTGDVVIKTTKKRRKFFGCSRYPDCKWASWRRPQAAK